MKPERLRYRGWKNAFDPNEMFHNTPINKETIINEFAKPEEI